MESYGSFDGAAAGVRRLRQQGAVLRRRGRVRRRSRACAPVLPRVKRRVVTYGLEEPRAQVRRHATSSSARSAAAARCPSAERRTASKRLGALELPVPGRHNLQNALAAVAVGERIGVEFAARGRRAARVPRRRAALRASRRSGAASLVVDDYGHHPTEIAAVLAAARATLDRRLVVAFQPHRYSRTQQLMDDVRPGAAGRRRDRADRHLRRGRGADRRRHASRRWPRRCARGSGRPVRLVRHARRTSSPRCCGSTRPGDAVITLGAGSIGTVPQRLVDGAARSGGERTDAGLRARRQALPPRARQPGARARGCAGRGARVAGGACSCGRLLRRSTAVAAAAMSSRTRSPSTRITVQRQLAACRAARCWRCSTASAAAAW